MGIGYIKLYRAIQDCWIWFDDDKFTKGQAWVDLLMLANHRDKKVPFNDDIITIERGQYLTSMRKLSERWGWSISTVSRFLTLLEKDEMIIRNSNTNRTLITIVNYGIYQDGETPNDTPTEHKPNSSRTVAETNNNDKEYIKNDKNNKKHYVDDEKLNQVIIDFINHRKKIKSPMTDRAIELFLNRLNKLSDDPAEQIRLIETAIERGWKSVYPSKEPIQKTAAYAEPEKHEESPLKIQFLEDDYFKRVKE